MRKWATILLGATLLFAITACNRNNNGAPDQASPAPGTSTTPAGTASAPAASPSGSAAASTVDAEAVYKKNCIACHAADLHGGVGPNLQQVGSRLTVDQIGAKIENGGGGMTAFKGVLTADEIGALAQWLSTQKG